MPQQDKYAELLKQIAASLQALEVTTREIGTFLAASRLRAEAQIAAIRAQSPEAAAAFDNKLMSGRWPRRDGTGYVTNRQPPIVQPSPDPEPHADSKTGHLRSSDLG